MSEIDQQFIEYVVKSLVGKPEAVKVDRRIDEKGVLLELTVDPEDLGRVIGKRGATAQSLRTLLRALGTKNDARYNLKIIDNGTPPPAMSSAKTDDNVPPEDKDESAPAPAEADNEPAEIEADKKTSDDASDRIRQAREELADLDDLDV
jgi:predicted RNA-binding protein YlqC (UPF0109 family)